MLRMDIPVFVSCPTSLSREQEQARKLILDELTYLNLEPRALGRSDYPTGLPLREVMVLARHCSGGVILGFEQFRATRGVGKRATSGAWSVGKKPVVFPTSWNHLEAGILVSLRLPLLVFREEGISGGVFDPGVTDVFVHPMPRRGMKKADKNALREVFLKWQSSVRARYYDELPPGAPKL